MLIFGHVSSATSVLCINYFRFPSVSFRVLYLPIQMVLLPKSTTSKCAAINHRQERGRHVNHKQLHPHARTRARLFRVKRWQRTKPILCRSSRDNREDREFYQGKTVKTHSNILVALVHVQLKSFYRLSTRDVIHVRECTRPSPA